MTKQQEKIVLNVLKDYLGEQKKRRGTIIVNCYGHDCSPYTGLISLIQDQRVDIRKEKDTDIGVSFPISRYIGTEQIEVSYIHTILDEEQKLVYQRKK